MALYRATVIIKSVTNVIEDASTNTYHFDANTVGDLAAVSAALQTCYQSMRTFYSSLMAQNGHEIKFYRLSDAPPRATVRNDTFNFTTAPSNAPLPTEVALVVSFQGGQSSGQPQARRRGRIFFGPMNTQAVDGTAFVAAATRTAAVNAWGVLLDASQAATEWKWSVFSTVNGTGVEVQNGWVDNAFDTQRRRGRRTTARTVFI
jgi:hypothetical protein